VTVLRAPSMCPHHSGDADAATGCARVRGEPGPCWTGAAHGATAQHARIMYEGRHVPVHRSTSRHRRPCFRERSGVRLMRTMSGPPTHFN